MAADQRVPFLPTPGPVLPDETAAWYQNITAELDQIEFSPRERSVLEAYYREAGLLRTWRRPFFCQHFGSSFERAARFLLEGKTRPAILDLGCGTGTQSLFFAMKGARVASLDMDAGALEILTRRKEFYEAKAGRALYVTAVAGNAHSADYQRLGPFDGVHSMFAFNLMQPSESLLDCLIPHMSDKGRMAIIDGNRLSLAARTLPWRHRSVLSPLELARALQVRRVSVVDHRGAVVFPPLLWRMLPRAVIAPIDRVLSGNWLFPISHQLLGELRQTR